VHTRQINLLATAFGSDQGGGFFDTGRVWLGEAGYTDISLHMLSEMAKQHDLLQPMRDLAFITRAYQPV
ncbi:MAG: hypothetical protein ACOCYT_04720, partial [Chloroflexota bacterium]